MSANRFNGFTNLGIGVGLRVPHYSFILQEKPPIGWFEIISENFMVDGGPPLEILEGVLESYPVVQHGVSMYLGSTDRLDDNYLQKLKKLVQRTKTPFASDHLCWGSANGVQTHDLLPLPYTREAVDHIAARILRVQDFLEIPFCIENISSYTEFNASTMTEWQFLSEVAEAADCGILLDVNNVFVASFNHGFDANEYLDNIPHSRVAQIHLAGHTDCDGYLLDTHDNFVKDEVWQLYRKAVWLCGETNTLLEWDGNFPDFPTLCAEAHKAKRYIEEAQNEGKQVHAA
jgi:uncharacterized protein (UPF0276 family)